MNIHPTAIVDAAAKIGQGVQIGAFAVIGVAHLGDGVIVHPHVVIADGVTIGSGCEIFPGAVIGREPKGAGATARQPVFQKVVDIGADCSIGPHAVIYYDVTIGANTLIGDAASIREGCSIGSRCLISRLVTINYDTIVGDRTKVMDGTHLTGKMIFGEDVFISVLVGSMNDNFMGREGFGGHVAGPHIHDRAVIGGGAMLLPGVVIGCDATVASGAVVSKSVPAGGSVAGVPARSFARPGAVAPSEPSA